MKAFSIFFIMILMGCSASKRVHRIVKKHPELAHTIDSVVVREYESYDTQTIINHIDSIVINNQSVTTKIYRHYDTFRVEQEIKPDTIVKYITKIQPYKKEFKRSQKWIWGLCLIFVLIILILIK